MVNKEEGGIGEEEIVNCWECDRIVLLKEYLTMFEQFKESLASWKKNYSERQQMQHAYLMITLLVVLVSGVVSLLNQDLGQSLVLVAVLAGGIFLINAIVWSILESSVIAKIGRKKK